MKWSFSGAHAFKQCQRSWYFKNCLANGIAKDPERHEAYLLSKLQSISAWRGNLVDKVFSEKLVEALNRKQQVTKALLLSAAKSHFENELDFALKHRIREPGLKISQNESFAAFREIEYGKTIAEDEISKAWNDIELAINNLFEMETLRTLLKSSSYVIAQRSIQFPVFEASIVARPDLIAFNENAPPLIVDWKVHTFGTRDYRLQLALYALALSRCKPHKDFPISLKNFKPTEFRLWEAQLLTGVEHEYVLDESDFEQLEDFISASSAEMVSAIAGLENGELNAEDFSVTKYPDICQRCSFRKICWEDQYVRN